MRQASLKFRDGGTQPDIRRVVDWTGISAEYVCLQGARALDFGWTGQRQYVALHDMKMKDGETRLDGVAPQKLLDLRDRLTFIPKGRTISGWSDFSNRSNSYTAVYFDAAVIPEELEQPKSADYEPILYFSDANIRSTLLKIQTLITGADNDAIYAETLGLTVAIEVARLQRNASPWKVPKPGGLSLAQERLIRDYIAANLQAAITLSDLASVAKLSRFHFARAFKATFGLPPHQFVLSCRVERARSILLKGDAPLRKVAGLAGFGSNVQLSRAFLRFLGRTPSQFLRGQR